MAIDDPHLLVKMIFMMILFVATIMVGEILFVDVVLHTLHIEILKLPVEQIAVLSRPIVIALFPFDMRTTDSLTQTFTQWIFDVNYLPVLAMSGQSLMEDDRLTWYTPLSDGSGIDDPSLNPIHIYLDSFWAAVLAGSERFQRQSFQFVSLIAPLPWFILAREFIQMLFIDMHEHFKFFFLLVKIWIFLCLITVYAGQ